MIVMDCCAAVEVVKGSERGRALSMLALKGEEIIVPDLFYAEATSYAWKATVFEGNPEKEMADALSNMLQLVDEFVDSFDLVLEAFSEACRYKHSVYDLFYAVLARRTGATLFTVDKRLIELCEQMGVNVVTEIEI